MIQFTKIRLREWDTMLFYHATSKKLGDQIINDGFIKHIVPRIHTLPVPIYSNGIAAKTATTDGYVYLSTSPFMAITYACTTAFIKNENKIMLFRLQIDEKRLVPDLDELSHHCVRWRIKYPQNITTRQCIEACYCVAAGFDIGLKEHKAQYAVLPSLLYGEDITRKDAEFTLFLRNITNDFLDGTARIEENPAFLNVINMIQSLEWLSA